MRCVRLSLLIACGAHIPSLSIPPLSRTTRTPHLRLFGRLTSKPKPIAKNNVPNDAPPADWEALASATFHLLDKEGAGYITAVPADFAGYLGHCSEISVLGDEVLKRQKLMGDVPVNLHLSLADWIGLLRERASSEFGSQSVEAFLEVLSMELR